MNHSEQPLKSKKILVVDDEPTLLEIVTDELDRAGATVFQCSSGNEAIEFLSQNSVDAILSDVRMPNGSGIDLMKNVRSHNSKTPIIFMVTGYSDLTHRQMTELGANAVFDKPYDFDVLVAQLTKQLLTDEGQTSHRNPK